MGGGNEDKRGQATCAALTNSTDTYSEMGMMLLYRIRKVGRDSRNCRPFSGLKERYQSNWVSRMVIRMEHSTTNSNCEREGQGRDAYPRRNSGYRMRCTSGSQHRSAERNLARQWPTRP